MEKAAQGLSAS